MAIPFVFTHRHLGYQIGCGVLLLATVLGLFGVVSPGWYRVENSKTGKQYYSHLWIVCTDGLSSCGFLSADKTKDFEKATQALAVLGLLSLVMASLLAVYLNFVSQIKGNNRLLEINTLVAGGVTFLAAVTFVLNLDNTEDKNITVASGYGVALTFTTAILAVVAGVLMLVFTAKATDFPSKPMALSTLRGDDPVQQMHQDIEVSQEGISNQPADQSSPNSQKPDFDSSQRRRLCPSDDEATLIQCCDHGDQPGFQHHPRGRSQTHTFGDSVSLHQRQDFDSQPHLQYLPFDRSHPCREEDVSFDQWHDHGKEPRFQCQTLDRSLSSGKSLQQPRNHDNQPRFQYCSLDRSRPSGSGRQQPRNHDNQPLFQYRSLDHSRPFGSSQQQSRNHDNQPRFQHRLT